MKHRNWNQKQLGLIRAMKLCDHAVMLLSRPAGWCAQIQRWNVFYGSWQ